MKGYHGEADLRLTRDRAHPTRLRIEFTGDDRSRYEYLRLTERPPETSAVAFRADLSHQHDGRLGFFSRFRLAERPVVVTWGNVVIMASSIGIVEITVIPYMRLTLWLGARHTAVKEFCDCLLSDTDVDREWRGHVTIHERWDGLVKDARGVPQNTGEDYRIVVRNYRCLFGVPTVEFITPCALYVCQRTSAYVNGVTGRPVSGNWVSRRIERVRERLRDSSEEVPLLSAAAGRIG